MVMGTLHDCADVTPARRWQHRRCRATEVVADLDDPGNARSWTLVAAHLGTPVGERTQQAVRQLVYVRDLLDRRQGRR